ncbi:MAG: sugar O-acetyltransferase [Bacteroidaceae bacterium]|nr:sugar O-acetyltransferase [Bacteroidaceae bacterium]
MTELQKMRSERLYRFDDKEVEQSFVHAKRLCARLQTMTLYDADYRAIIEDLIPSIPTTSSISPPFMCDHGHGIRLGEHVFVNAGCTMLDSGFISIGNNVKIGPNCRLLTPTHPMDYVERREPKETALPVTIGDDCWLGAGVIVCPGVTIGPRCIIAAGAVVTRDIPADTLAAGIPATVKRNLQ